ncbi:MAG: electron transfer flavoprotein subunit beta/FixA family protein [Spirochaetales bacterium]|jgi:electron transfer flavoprotein beta subunit|nr:electron transfer flavoprotein subunit beta/FixA family protein [Spirochaetales bacterium]
MSFHLIVLVKQVPDTSGPGFTAALNQDGTINRKILPAVINREDLYALEGALEIKDRFPGVSVTLLSMGPPSALAALKEGLCRGADRGILVTGQALAGSDTLATSYVLYCALKRLEPFDLVFCGLKSSDGDTAQVGPELAERLGINHLASVSEIEDGAAGFPRRLTLRRTQDTREERIEAALPLLLSFNDRGREVRPVKARRALGLRKAEGLPGGGEGPLWIWEPRDIGADEALCGAAGSPTRVISSRPAAGVSRKALMIGETDEALAAMAGELRRDRLLG